MVSFTEQVASNIEKRRLFCPGQRILLAVSGGVDSMVLLHLLHELSRGTGWKLTVAHLNHGLRGASSLADERLVRRVAEALKLPVAVSRADVRSFAKAKGLSLEMAGRELRHDFLAQVARQRAIPSIALGHHLDDQLELFFLRLLRGSGSQGLAGMRWRSPSPSGPEVTLVRPLLDCSKHTLRQYAIERKIRFREDATNRSLDVQRNRVRHTLLPLLKREYQPGLEKTVLRVMDILGAESDFVNAAAQSWLLGRENRLTAERSHVGAPNRGEAPLADFLSGCEAGSFETLPVAVQRRCVQLKLIRLGIAPEFDLVEHLRLYSERPIEIPRTAETARVLARPNRSGEPAETPALGGLRLMRNGQGIVLVRAGVSAPFREGGIDLNLRESSGKLEWEGMRFSWQILPNKRKIQPGRKGNGEYFDAEAVGQRVILRHWRPGDRFQPIGMAQAVKLQDLFVNQKVPRERRRHLAVATTECGDLFWVEGLRISERFKLTNSTIRRLHWAWQRF